MLLLVITQNISPTLSLTTEFEWNGESYISYASIYNLYEMMTIECLSLDCGEIKSINNLYLYV